MNKLRYLLVAGVGALALTGCTQTVTETHHINKTDRTYNYAPEALDVNNRSIHLYEGETTKITSYIEPSLANEAKLVYTSKNPQIASVDDNGVVTAKGKGNTVITVKFADDENIAVDIPVYILENLSIAKLDTKMADMLAYQQEHLPEVHKFVESRHTEFYKVRLENPEESDKSKQKRTLIDGYQENEEYMMDVDEGFFRLGGRERKVPTEGGATEYVNYAWMAHNDEYYETHMYHINGTTKTMYNIPTQSYIGKDRMEAVYDLFGLLFRNGRTIVTNALKLATDTDELSDNYTKYKSLIQKGGANDDNTVSYKLVQNGYKDKVSPEDESDMEIWAGTEFIQDYEQSIVWKDGFVASAKIYYENKYVDKLDGKTYIDTNLIEYRYEVNDDANITLPNPKDYTEVYELYDL